MGVFHDWDDFARLIEGKSVNVLLTRQAKDGGEDAAIARADGCDVELVGLPVVGSDAVLGWSGAHDHGGPVGAADRREDATRARCTRRVASDQIVEDRRLCLLDAIGAQSVKAEDHHMVGGCRGAGRREK